MTAATTELPVAPATDATPAPGPRPPVALYIHIPFCVSICPYCDFVVYAGAAARGPRNRVELFVAALMRELELRAEALDRRFGPRPPLASVYLGGGT
ncbi:MAG: coproporphyrinogen III oxidase, partial [Chloroflexi bacterium]